MPIQVIKEVKDLIKEGNCLSPSLRLTKYAKIGDKNEKKAAIEFFTQGSQENLRPKIDIPNGQTFIMRLGDKMIINQAGGVLENAGLCIHRHFGYPYIPGSALKGIARHAAWLDWVDEDEPQKKKIAIEIARTFGYPTNENELDSYLSQFPDFKRGKNGEKDGRFVTVAGSVSFLPAVPEGSVKLETEVLTCHHMDYYAGKSDKALDNESPIPVFFPVVAEGASFKFTIVPLRRAQILDFDALQFAQKYLKKGIEEQGVGAKTAAGYGWFDLDPAIKKAEEARLVEEKRQEEERIKLADEQAEKDAQAKKWAEDDAKKARIKAEEEAKAVSEKINQGFSHIKDETALGSILAQASKLKEAQSKELEESQKSELIEILKHSHEVTGAKDKKWKSGKKSKDAWKKIRALLGDNLTNELKEQLS